MTRPRPDRSPNGGTDLASRELQVFASSVVHELRTPLSALSGEVELALHRERSPTAYREALGRIADRVSELVDITSDLALYGARGRPAAASSGQSDLTAILTRIAGRFGPPETTGVQVEVPRDVSVLGEEPLLARGLTLLVQHATRHRQPDGSVRLRVVASEGLASDPGAAHCVIEVTPPRFPGRTWHHLDPGPETEESVNTSGLFRLRTAARLLHQCGVEVRVRTSEESDAVHLHLRRTSILTGIDR